MGLPYRTSRERTPTIENGRTLLLCIQRITKHKETVNLFLNWSYPLIYLPMFSTATNIYVEKRIPTVVNLLHSIKSWRDPIKYRDIQMCWSLHLNSICKEYVLMVDQNNKKLKVISETLNGYTLSVRLLKREGILFSYYLFWFYEGKIKRILQDLLFRYRYIYLRTFTGRKILNVYLRLVYKLGPFSRP